VHTRGAHPAPNSSAATAEVVRAKGYAKITVGDIIAVAVVSREAFYTYIHEKEQAYAEMVTFVFEQIMARSAGAFFAASEGWPAQVWEGGRAFTGVVSAEPSFAYIFVESYAVSSGVQRSDEFLPSASIIRNLATSSSLIIALSTNAVRPRCSPPLSRPIASSTSETNVSACRR
jgi:AcrR family transcriptional regulator